MPKQYRVGAFVRFNNAVMKSLLRTDVPVGTFEILTVRIAPSPRSVPTRSSRSVGWLTAVASRLAEWESWDDVSRAAG